MYTWIGAPCSSRYTGLHSCTAAAQRLLRRAEYTCWHRRGPHASINSPIQHVRNHPRRLLCLPCLPGEMETSTLFLTRLDDDRGLERSLEPTHLGTRGTHLHSRSVTHLSRVDRGSVIQPSAPTKQFIPHRRAWACDRASGCLFVASWLGVCRHPSCCICMCMYQQSMTLRSLVASLLSRTKFPAHKEPSAIVKVDISTPCSTNEFRIQGPERQPAHCLMWRAMRPVAVQSRLPDAPWRLSTST